MSASCPRSLLVGKRLSFGGASTACDGVAGHGAVYSLGRDGTVGGDGSGVLGGAAGGVFAAQERCQLVDGAHERCGKDDGGVLVDADLDQRLQVSQLQCEGVG